MGLDTTRQARHARRVAWTVLHWRSIALLTGEIGRRNPARRCLPYRHRADPAFLYRHGLLWVDRWRKRRGEIDELEHRHPYGRRHAPRRG